MDFLMKYLHFLLKKPSQPAKNIYIQTSFSDICFQGKIQDAAQSKYPNNSATSVRTGRITTEIQF